MKLSTLKVVLINKEELNYPNLDETAVNKLMETIWTRGVKKRINERSHEIVSPFVIHQAFIIEQDGKI